MFVGKPPRTGACLTYLVCFGAAVTACHKANEESKPTTPVAQIHSSDTWFASGKTSIEVTGDVQFTDQRFISASQVIPIKLNTEMAFVTQSEGSRRAQIFEVTGNTAPRLLRGNLMCDAPIRWIAAWHPSTTELHLAVYAGSSPPQAEMNGLCADYLYTTDQKQAELRRSMLSGGAGALLSSSNAGAGVVPSAAASPASVTAEPSSTQNSEYAGLSTDFQTCHQAAQSTYEIDDCIKAEDHRLDVSLGITYHEMMNNPGGNSVGSLKLRDDERAWIRKMNAHCALAASGGSGAGVSSGICQLHEKSARLDYLRGLQAGTD